MRLLNADTSNNESVTGESVMDRWTSRYALETADCYRRARRTAGAILICAVAYSVGAGITLAQGQPGISIAVFLVVFGMLLCSVALRSGVRIDFVAHGFVAANAAVVFTMILATGGESIGFLIATPLIPAFAMLVGDRRSVAIWSALTVSVIAVAVVLISFDFAFPIRPDQGRVAVTKHFVTIVVVATIFGISHLFLTDRINTELEFSQMRDRAEEISRQLRLAARTARLGHWTFDRDSYRYVDISEEYARIFGYTVSEFMKRFLTREQHLSLVHPDDRERVGQTYRDYEKLNFEYRIIRRDGSVRTVHEITRDIPGEFDDHARYDGTLQDITELRLVETRLRAALEAAESASRAKSAFLANMSHELRTPLTTIIGYSELMQNRVTDNDAGVATADLQKIHSAGTHLLAMISDALDLSRIDAGKIELHVSTFDVKEIVEEVVATCAQLIEQNGNTIVVNCPPATGDMRSDVTKIRQVLFNLLSNAAKFTENGRIEVTVRREMAEGFEQIVIEVRDSGIGIESEHAASVFDAFMQVKSSTQSGKPGTGLGLTITREYCQLLGGSLELLSTPGEGSVFTAAVQACITPALATAADAYYGTSGEIRPS